MDNHPRYRSLFWPILLVGVGIVWLLSNLGMIQPVNVGSILRLWPLVLIVLGLDILFSRRYPWVGAVVGLLAVAGVVAFLITGPKLGLNTGPVTKTETFSSLIDGATSAKFVFDTSSSPVHINALDADDEELILAEIGHRGTIRFDVNGTSDKTVRLTEDFNNTGWFYWDFSFDQLRWDIALSPNVPSEVVLNGGSGSIEMDLRDMQLTSLRTDLGSGSSTITLPETNEAYTAEIESGSGSVTLDLPGNTSLELTLDTGSGSTSISVPSNAAVRIEVEDDGSGSLNLPNDLEKSTDSPSFSIGAWQTPGFDQADNQILIRILGQGSGSISIH